MVCKTKAEAMPSGVPHSYVFVCHPEEKARASSMMKLSVNRTLPEENGQMPILAAFWEKNGENQEYRKEMNELSSFLLKEADVIKASPHSFLLVFQPFLIANLPYLSVTLVWQNLTPTMLWHNLLFSENALFVRFLLLAIVNQARTFQNW